MGMRSYIRADQVLEAMAAVLAEFLAGALGSVTTKVFVFPFETVRVILAVRKDEFKVRHTQRDKRESTTPPRLGPHARCGPLVPPTSCCRARHCWFQYNWPAHHLVSQKEPCIYCGFRWKKSQLSRDPQHRCSRCARPAS